MEKRDGREGLRVNVGKTKVMKCQVGSGRWKVQINGHVVYVRRALVETLFAVRGVRNGFTRDVVGRQGDCKILLGFDALDVLLRQ